MSDAAVVRATKQPACAVVVRGGRREEEEVGKTDEGHKKKEKVREEGE